MSNDIKNNRNNENKGNTENIPSLKTSNGFILTSENDFKNIDKEEHLLTKKFVKFMHYTGEIECIFTILNIRCAAIDVGEIQEMEHVIEVDLFNKKFQGIIVKYDDANIVEIGSCVDYIGDTKFIDISKGCHLRTVNNENEETKYRYVKIKNSFKKSSPTTYGLCIQRVKINGVDCMQIKKNIQHDDSENHYVRITDFKVSDKFEAIQFHNNVIFKPELIFKYDNTTKSTLNLKDKVRFKDCTETNYQGKVLWIGKVNDVSAVIVSLKENYMSDDIKQCVLNESIMETHFKIKKSGICVGHFNIIEDVISYKLCKKSNLEIVDPKFIYPFEKVEFQEKILVFKLNKTLNAVILKWKGRIYNQLCMGCELSYDSDEGCNGTYGGKDKLFECAPKRGVLITSEKLNDQEITDLCEYSNHKNLLFISTKPGFEIYDQTSICCIEKLDGIEVGKENLKIGCKIMYQGKFIGICMFIGKVNSKPSIGIELSRDDINEIPEVFDFINFFVLRKGKLCFMDLDIVDIGTFYKDFSKEIANTKVTYHPGNDPNKSIPCEVRWLCKHDNGNTVYAAELESEMTENSSCYFLENSFSDTSKQYIIDDEYKFEHNLSMECGRSAEDNSKNYDKIIRCLLNGQVMNVINELLIYYPNNFIDYLQANKETMMKPENLEIIINVLYEKCKIEQIINILTGIENINKIFPVVKSLLSKCIEDKRFDFISEILSRLETFQKSDDINNQICLILAMKCLENMKEENNKDYQLIYESFIGLCGNYNCNIVDGNYNETFITKIIFNKSIMEGIIINVLKSGIFDVNQTNFNNKSPMEIAIDECRPNILKALFDLEILNTNKLECIFKQLMGDLKNQKTEMLEIITLINEQLESKNPKTNSSCGNKEKEDSN